MAKAYENDNLADASPDELLRALEECREQLRRAEELLRRNRHGNSPKRKPNIHPPKD